MAGEARDAEFRHLEAVAFLESLTDEQAAKQPPLILEQDCVVARYWREGVRALLRGRGGWSGTAGSGKLSRRASARSGLIGPIGVAACLRYYEANADRMRYDLCRKLGLPVGSGVVESACKQIVSSRFKRAGCHWSKAGANALLAVKCCFENRCWADFLDWRACHAAAA